MHLKDTYFDIISQQKDFIEKEKKFDVRKCIQLC